jgi:excisionase family DNA binding protein
LDRTQKVQMSDRWEPMSSHATPHIKGRSALLDVVQASAYLGCSVRYVRRLIQERRIPFIRLGGHKIRFNINDLDQWIDAQRVAAKR